MKPKWEGVLFFFFILLIGAVAVNSGNNLVYLTFSTILSFLVLSGLLSYFNLKGMNIKIQNPEFVFANKETILFVTITNTSKMPKFLINVRLFNTKTHFIYTEKEATKKVKITFKSRGTKEIKFIEVNSVFPFGFFERIKKIPITFRITVAPSVKDVIFESSSATEKKNNSAKFRGDEEFFLIRKYKDGEDSRKISWPVSAKTGKIMIVEKTGNSDKKIKFLFDNAKILYKNSFEFEDNLEKITSAIYYCFKQQCMVSLISEKNFAFSNDAMHFKRIFDYLATINAKEKLPLRKVSDAISPSDIKYA